jgi:hypothetical protein
MNSKKAKIFIYVTNITSIALITIIVVMLYYVWRDIYDEPFNLSLIVILMLV